MDKQPVIFKDLGIMEYKAAWDLQESLLQENLHLKAEARLQSGATPATRHYFLICEHPPVYTLGKSGLMEHVLIPEEKMEEEGIGFFRTNRGGDITFHGPGQIVGYPIMDLEKFYTDIGRYLRELEEVIIKTLAAFGIKGDRSAGETGVWIDPGVPGRERKICAMGVRCSRWVTMHGFALNVNTDLSYFNNIIPCGIQNKAVTSMEKESGGPLQPEQVKRELLKSFEDVFGVRIMDNPLQVIG